MATTVTEVRTELYNWIDLILNTEGGEDLKIVFSHQNAPRPEPGLKKAYIVIHQWPTRLRDGRENQGSADDQGVQSIHNDYQDTWTIEEVNGTGDRLRVLIESQDRQDIRDRFTAAGLAYRGQASGIEQLPEEIEGRWYYRHTVDIRIGLVSTQSYTSSYIGIVDPVGTVGGHTI